MTSTEESEVLEGRELLAVREADPTRGISSILKVGAERSLYSHYTLTETACQSVRRIYRAE